MFTIGSTIINLFAFSNEVKEDLRPEGFEELLSCKVFGNKHKTETFKGMFGTSSSCVEWCIFETRKINRLPPTKSFP